MYFRTAAAVFALTSGIAQSQQIDLRSGDHPTFSRLTLPLSEGQNWQARKTEQGVEVTLEDFNGSFNTAAVFLRMKQDRISAITATQDTLNIQVTCDCDATAFRSGSLLVIDVADRGTPLAGPALEGGAIRPRQRQSTSSAMATPVRPALPWIGGGSPFVTLSATPKAPKVEAPVLDDSNALSDRAALLNQVRDDLAERVANAASSGLLENSMPVLATAQPHSQQDPESTALPPRELPEAIQSPSWNMRITSSMDLPDGFGDAVLDVTANGISCPSDGFLAIGNWGDESSFSAQLGPKRNALMNARDQLNPGATEELAKLYLFFGFGAEALSALRLEPDAATAHPELMTVAHILEYGEGPSFNPLASYTDCASDVALWAVLSLHEIPSGTLIDTQAALRGVNKLPKHLRQVVAPALSAKLLEYGDADAAASAMRSIERLPESPTPEAIMAQAEIAMDAGESASALLEEVIEANTQQSPEALVKLVKAKLSKDEPLPYEMATLVEAYAQELRGTEMGSQLRRTQVIALSQSQHFGRAFDALEELKPSLSPKVHSDLRNTVLEQLGTKADDLIFLEQIFAQAQTALTDLPVATKLMLAKRMMNLGFGAQVQQIIVTIPDRPRNAERQLLAARAAIQLQQPFQAQAALIGIDDPDAALLMAQAKEMVGAYSEAYEIFASNNAPDRATQAAWLSDDWRDLTASEQTNFGAIATIGRSAEQDQDSLIGPLGRADRALEESAAARITLERLLSDPAVQIPPDS